MNFHKTCCFRSIKRTMSCFNGCYDNFQLENVSWPLLFPFILMWNKVIMINDCMKCILSTRMLLVWSWVLQCYSVMWTGRRGQRKVSLPAHTAIIRLLQNIHFHRGGLWGDYFLYSEILRKWCQRKSNVLGHDSCTLLCAVLTGSNLAVM